MSFMVAKKREVIREKIKRQKVNGWKEWRKMVKKSGTKAAVKVKPIDCFIYASMFSKPLVLPHPTWFCPLSDFFIFNIFCKLILNLTLFYLFFPKLTLFAAPTSLARWNACAAPCMVARREGWRGDDRGTDRWRGRVCRATDLGAAVTQPYRWRVRAG